VAISVFVDLKETRCRRYQSQTVDCYSFAMRSLLRLERLGRRFGQGPWLFQNLDFSLEAGQQVALRGESGVGKSTLLNLIAGLDQPSAGRVLFEGVDLAAMSDAQRLSLRRQSIGFVFQAFHLLPHLSAIQNAMVPCLLAGMSLSDAHKRAFDLLDSLGMKARAHAALSELSGGEQQRVALARSVVHSPKLILADEPTGNLDPETARRALDLLAACCRENNAALLMVTHSDQAAARFGLRMQLRTDGLSVLE
jgi:putative ABC transport system ATP-binding protein